MGLDYLHEVLSENWPAALRREVALICTSHGVASDSVSVWEIAPDSEIAIRFSIVTDDLIEEPAAPISSREIIAFIYDAMSEVGIKAPIVVAERDDFPRDLGHLNPAPLDLPASICLARPDHQALYDRFGVAGTVSRLVQWMRDAKTGGLMSEGWHPIPVAGGQMTLPGMFDGANFQELAASKSTERRAAGVARASTRNERADYVVVLPGEYRVVPGGAAPLAKAVALPKELHGKDIVQVPWLFVWSDPVAPIESPVFGAWRTLDDTYAALDPYELKENTEIGIGEVLNSGASCGCLKRNAIVLIIGLWRPVPMLPSIYGLSEDPHARALEIKAYWLDWALNSRYEAPTSETNVNEIVTLPLPGPSLFQHMSDVGKLPRVAQLGCGAFGSELAENLIRAGIDDYAVADKDIFLPHNLARSNGKAKDVGYPKVDIVKDSAETIAFGVPQTSVDTRYADILTMTDGELATFLGSAPVLIDATADERVRARLTKFPLPEGCSIIRTEIAHGGQLGLVSVAAPEGPDLLDLYYALVILGQTEKSVRDWLRSDVQGRRVLEELILGFGCSSITTRLPKYVVSQHAAATMPTIFHALTATQESGIGLNPLDNSFRPNGWRWFPVGPFVQLQGEIASGWDVRIAPLLPEQIEKYWQAYPDIEVGGYLYGVVDYPINRITVVAASQVSSISSPKFVVLAPSSTWSGETPLYRRTGGRIQMMGTWHSHPQGPSFFSSRDRATFNSHRKGDVKHALPTLVVIATPEGLRALMEV